MVQYDCVIVFNLLINDHCPWIELVNSFVVNRISGSFWLHPLAIAKRVRVGIYIAPGVVSLALNSRIDIVVRLLIHLLNLGGLEAGAILRKQ